MIDPEAPCHFRRPRPNPIPPLSYDRLSFTNPRCDFRVRPQAHLAPQGRNIPARGNALGIGADYDPALKGRNITSGRLVSPCQGSGGLDDVPCPGALPWADMFRPF